MATKKLCVIKSVTVCVHACVCVCVSVKLVSKAGGWLASRFSITLNVECSQAMKLVSTVVLWPVCPPELSLHPQICPRRGIEYCGQNICHTCSLNASPDEPRHVCETPVQYTQGVRGNLEALLT